MLAALRRNVRNFRWLLWLVILSMVAGLIVLYSTVRGGGSAPHDVAIAVEGVEMTNDDVRTARNELINQYRQILGENFDQFSANLDFDKLAIQRVKQTAMLLAIAMREGIEVTPEEVIQSIKNLDVFHSNGVFNSAIYHEILRRNQINAGQFEANVRRDITVQRVSDRINQMVVVSREEVWKDYVEKNETAKINYALFTPASFMEGVEVSEEDIKARYDSNLSAYMLPEKVKLKYLAIDKSALEEQIALDDAEIKASYDENPDQYTSQEEVRARHILFKVAKDLPPEQKAAIRDTAENVLKEAKGGADFAELAKKYSQDSSAAQGGDLGFFTKDRMVPEFANAAFALQPGGLSEIVESQFGFHIIKVEEKKPAGKQPFGEVETEIRTALKQEKATKKSEELVKQANELAAQSKTLADISAAMGLDVKETPLFAKGESVPNFMSNATVLDEAFSLEQGKVSKPLDVFGRVTYFLTPVEKVAGHQGNLDEVKDRIRATLTEERAAEKAHEAAQKALEGTGPANWEEALTAKGLAPKDTRVFKRGEFLQDLGRSAPLDEAVFALDVNGIGPVVKLDKGVSVIFKVTEREHPSDKDFSDNFLVLKDQVLSQKQSRFFSWYLKQFEQEHPMTNNLEEPGV